MNNETIMNEVMKQLHIIISTLLLILGGASVKAQTLYDFSEWNTGDITSTMTNNGLTVVATTDKTMKIASSSQSIDGYTFTKTLQLGGAGASNSRFASITIPSGGTITAYFMSGKSGSERTLNLAIGSFSNVVASKANDGKSMGSVSYTYTGEEEATLYVYSAGSGINLYGIVYQKSGSSVDPSGTTTTEATEGTPFADISTHAVTQDLTSNQMEVQLTNGDIKYYNTKTLTSVNIDKENAKVTLLNGDGESDIYYGSVKHIGFSKKADSGQEGDITNNGITITESKGWHESCYIEWTPISAATSYNVYVKGGNYAEYTQIDGPLVRNYGTYGRADMVGLIPGTYSMKVVGVDANGNELSANGIASNLEVINYQREGFAFHTWTAGVGAYKNDGSLKSGARVFYVTASTAKTITCNVTTSSKGAVTACTGMQAIIDAYQKGYDTTPITFRIVGTINASDMDSFSSSAEGLQIKGNSADSELNITIEGIGEDATIKGFGFLIRNAKSVELRNFAIMNFMDDSISMDTDNSNIWVHHIDVFYGQKGSSADQVKGDGSIDIKSDSKYVTVSYCHFWDAGKSSLCGMKSESGPNYISYDHNWFDHSDSRHPRIRTMTVHVWNNYFDGNSKYGTGVTYGGSAFVEGNYFRNCKFPMLLSLQGNDVYAGTSTYSADNGTFSGEEGGIIKSYGNVITGSQSSYWPYGATTMLTKGSMKSASSLGINTQTHFDAYEVTSRNQTVPSTVKSYSGNHTYDNFDTNSSLMYTYTPDAAADVPAKVVGYYGAGRLNHGDFKWTFSDSEDTNASVIDALRTAINNYTSTLVGIYGDANQQGTGGNEGGEGGEGGEQGGEQGTTISSDVECNFQNSAPSNSAFTVVGNYSSSKGTATVNGTTYTTCLKIESSTSVKFTITTAMTLTLVFGSQDTKYTINVNNTKKTGSNGILTVDLDAGEYTLTKADTGNLFYIGLKAI